MTAGQAMRKWRNLQRHCAKKGIPFALTLKQWVDAWEDKIDQRGFLQLQRIEPAKGFVPGNLRIGRRNGSE
jgi:hypothetical protein